MSELEPVKYGYAQFGCGACKDNFELLMEDIFLLESDAPIDCPSCRVAVKAEPRDQQELARISKSLVLSGKLMMAFSVVWYPLSIIVILFVHSIGGWVMASLGLLIMLGLKSSAQVIEEVVVLKPFIND